jgi:hypothetical protein
MPSLASFRNSAANSAGGSGDDGYFVSKLFHGSLLAFVVRKKTPTLA